MPTQIVFDQFSAGICIGGRPAELWAPSFNPTARVVEVWVPSEAGKDYSICWRRRGDTGCDLGGVVTIDGCRVGGTSRVVTRWSMDWNEYSGQQTSGITERPFKFNEIQTTDDERVAVHQQLPPRPGEIVLEIYRVAIVGRAHPTLLSRRGPPPSGLIHERSKKVGCHMTRLGSERTSKSCSSVLAVPLTPLDIVPCATFIFRYRPSEILRAAGIMPPLLELSVSLSSKEDDDEEEDIEQAEAEIAALQ
ncbi:hypothetical protein FS837_001246, partial [Tulasnella sp. UAMH 9824]